LVNHEKGGITIYEKFLALDEKKQERIRNGGFRAFGKHGYEKTSAEEIAQSAGIAKGMIFYYFGTKKGLFEYLSDYMYRFMMNYIRNISDEIGTYDYLERLQKISGIKLKAYVENPYVFEFSVLFLFHPENLKISKKVEDIYESMVKLQEEQMELLIHHPDDRNLRGDVKKERLEQYLMWIIDGYTKQLIDVFAKKSLTEVNLDPYWEEFDEVLEDLRTLFYQQ